MPDRAGSNFDHVGERVAVSVRQKTALQNSRSLEDADNVRYDSVSKRLYVGYGQGALAIIDPDKAVKVAEIPLDGHPESFQLERNGDRIFVNVPTAGEIEVADRRKRSVLTRWRLTAAAANFPMALDGLMSCCS